MNARVFIRTAVFMAAALLAATAIAQNGPAKDQVPEKAIPAKNTIYLAKDIAHHPLKPPDISSPRATLISFIDSLNRAYRFIMTVNEQNTKTPGIFSSEATNRLGTAAEILFERGVYCLDLSQVPESRRQDAGWEAALQLKEILDRIELPPLDTIPDRQAVEEAKEENNGSEILRYRLTNTDIVIALVREGPRKGEFLFSPETVARLDEFLNKVKHLPYRSDGLVSKGFYDFYNSTPGRLLPPKWSIWLPEWSNVMYLQQTVWQWIALVILVAFGAAFSYLLYRGWNRRVNDHSHLKRAWSRVFLVLVEAGVIAFLLYLIDEQVNITGGVLTVVDNVIKILIWMILAWAAILGGDAVAETVIASPRIDPEGIHASLIKTVGILTGFISAAVIFFRGLSLLGVSIIPLVTGLGVGGLAIALAARPTLENLIGGIMILLDRPYRVGQRVKVEGHDGVVEKIGFRSTRIRLLSGHQATMPNEVMARMDIENVDRRPYIRRISNITITYDTPVEKIKRAVEIIREILEDHEGMLPNLPPRVFFNEFNAESLNIYMSYWFHPPDHWAAYAFDQKVNLRIMQEFEKEGIAFAFPTTTTILTQENETPLKISISGEKEGRQPDVEGPEK